MPSVLSRCPVRHVEHALVSHCRQGLGYGIFVQALVAELVADLGLEDLVTHLPLSPCLPQVVAILLGVPLA